MTTRYLGASLLAFALLLASGCGTDQICGLGTRLSDGHCVPVCSPGTKLDPETGRCVPDCLEGTSRDPDTGMCVPDFGQCVSGEVWDGEAEECVAAASMCAEGSIWSAAARACVSTDERRVPDYEEGSGENDPAFGSDFEWFELPETGGRVSIGGTIDAPRDKSGDGLKNPDFDLWLFTVDEPALLRVNAEGLGGATSGFMIVTVDPQSEWIRVGVGHTSSDVTRDIYLPHAGLYGLFKSDALNFFADRTGPHHGGGDMAYFVEIERLPIPTPTPLAFDGDLLMHEGRWPLEPPPEGSMLSFYSVEIEPRSMYWFEMGRDAGPLSEQLLVSGRQALFGLGSRGTLHGFLDGEELLIVVDYEYHMGFEDTRYAIAIERFPSTWVGEERTDVTVDQPEWNYGDLVTPFVWYGFEADAFEIVTAHVGSASGNTCFELYDAHFDWPYERLNCVIREARTLHEGEMRMIAPSSGLYGLASLDWEGALQDEIGTSHIPARVYDASLRISRQMPTYLGDSIGETSTSGEVDEIDPEQFFVLDARRGEMLEGRVTGELAAVASFYEPYVGPLTTLARSVGHRFVWRSFDGEGAIFGLRDADALPASFGLDLRPLVPHELGSAAPDVPFEEALVLSGGADAKVHRLGVETPGMVALNVMGDAGLVATVRNLNLKAIQGPTPLPAAFDQVANEDGIFLEIATADGAPLAEDAFAFLSAHLDPARSIEPGQGALNATRVNMPVAIAGALDHYDAIDWYSITLDQPTRLVSTVLPRGGKGVGYAIIVVFDDDDRDVVYDEFSGPGGYPAIDHLIEEPGTYFVAVAAFDEQPHEYLLELRGSIE